MTYNTIEEYDKDISALKDILLKEFVTAEIPVYSRVTGYYGAVKGWNPGKKEEFSQRVAFDYKKSLEIKNPLVRRVYKEWVCGL